MKKKQTDNEAMTQASNASFIRLRDTRKVMAQATTYSHVVGKLRWALPILVGLMLAALVLWPYLRTHKIKQMIAENIPNLVVENPHLSGMDASNQPYMLTAKRALMVPSDKNVIDLDKPEGELTLRSGSWLSGKANQGRYDQVRRQLWLGGDVQLFHDQGYQFSTEEAQADLARNNAWGEQPVLIQGAFGEITGNGFRLLDAGKVMIVTGHSHALLNLHALPSSGSSAGASKP